MVIYETDAAVTDAPRVLLVDDDQALCKMLSEYLDIEGMRITTRNDGESGLAEAMSDAHDIVILDVMLPDLPGIEVLRHIRQRSELPVIMLTARGDDLDRILGLELGADDYLSKPCNPRELLARLHSVLRRTRPVRAAAKALDTATKGLVMSSEQRTAAWHGSPLKLTSTEFNVLDALFTNSGKTLHKSELAALVLGHPLAPYDRSIDMHISNLRQKLGRLADGRSPIQTVHGKGYQFVVET